MFAAVVGVDDQGVMAAALGAERLGLSHNPPEAVARTRDKAAMRRALAQAGVPQPRFAQLPPGADVAAVVSEVGLPCVVKPVGLSGSRGVIRANDAEQVRLTVERVRGILASAQEPHARGVGAGQIDDDFDCVVGLENVERRCALAGERAPSDALWAMRRPS